MNRIATARAFTEAMQALWADSVKSDNMLFPVTDAAPCMKKPAQGISVSYRKLIHFTCVAYALHRVCETIRVHYPKVRKSLANRKKMFVKQSARIGALQKQSSRHPPPPQMSSNVTVYYAENLEMLRSVINELGRGDVSSTAVL